jgi:hypothetical protein
MPVHNTKYVCDHLSKQGERGRKPWSLSEWRRRPQRESQVDTMLRMAILRRLRENGGSTRIKRRQPPCSFFVFFGTFFLSVVLCASWRGSPQSTLSISIALTSHARWFRLWMAVQSIPSVLLLFLGDAATRPAILPEHIAPWNGFSSLDWVCSSISLILLFFGCLFRNFPSRAQEERELRPSFPLKKARRRKRERVTREECMKREDAKRETDGETSCK